jgi:aerotaxis receptor
MPWTGMVKNRCKNGDFYWVLANVTPVIESGKPVGYLSVRTKPDRASRCGGRKLYREIRAAIRAVCASCMAAPCALVARARSCAHVARPGDRATTLLAGGMLVLTGLLFGVDASRLAAMQSWLALALIAALGMLWLAAACIQCGAAAARHVRAHDGRRRPDFFHQIQRDDEMASCWRRCARPM